MKSRIALGLFLLATAARAAGLEWETSEQRRELPAGTDAVEFVFTATNRGTTPEQITEVLTSCDCLTAEPPEAPAIVAPGATVRLVARLALLDKTGEVRQEVWVRTTQGRQTLKVTAVLPRRGPGSR